MIRRPARSTQSRSSAASDVYKRQVSGRTHDFRFTEGTHGNSFQRSACKYTTKSAYRPEGDGDRIPRAGRDQLLPSAERHDACLLYTSDAADDLLCVDLG